MPNSSITWVKDSRRDAAPGSSFQSALCSSRLCLSMQPAEMPRMVNHSSLPAASLQGSEPAETQRLVLHSSLLDALRGIDPLTLHTVGK